MMIMCVCFEPFDPFWAKERIVLRKERSGLELKDLFENVLCTISTSISFLPCQLSVVYIIVSMLVFNRRSSKKKITYCTNSKSLTYWPKWVVKRVFSKMIELVTTSSKQSKDGSCQRLVYISTRCIKASKCTCGGSSHVIVLKKKKKKKKRLCQQSDATGKTAFYHPSLTSRTSFKQRIGPILFVE